MLVVVENWDVQLFAQPLFDFKTARCGDVLLLDDAKPGGDGFHGADNLIHVLGGQADGKSVYPAEFFK